MEEASSRANSGRLRMNVLNRFELLDRSGLGLRCRGCHCPFLYCRSAAVKSSLRVESGLVGSALGGGLQILQSPQEFGGVVPLNSWSGRKKGSEEVLRPQHWRRLRGTPSTSTSVPLEPCRMVGAVEGVLGRTKASHSTQRYHHTVLSAASAFKTAYAVQGGRMTTTLVSGGVRIESG